jgi:sensor domain CHASE-containing protein
LEKWGKGRYDQIDTGVCRENVGSAGLLYLDKIPQFFSSCSEREVADERQTFFTRPVDLQLVGLAYIAVVSAVAG